MKGKGMGYSGGKSQVGKKKTEPKVHCSSPSDIQTRTESSKNYGIGYSKGTK